MPAVVRVKRHIDEEPLGAFVLNAKRRRLDNENADAGAGAEIEDGEEVFGATLGTKKKGEISTVLKLAGTINNQDDAATTKFVRLTKEEALSRLTKEEAEELVKFRRCHPRTSDVLHRKREEKRQISQENRFRVVNCLRKPLLEKANEGEENRDEPEVSMGPKLTIVDIEKQPVGQAAKDEPSTSFATSGASSSLLYAESTNRASQVNTNASLSRGGNTQPSDSDTGYVYDLYLAEDQEEDDDYADMDDSRLSAYPVYEETFDMNNDEESDFDAEDSNEENYYTNDYPDSDSEPTTDYKIRKALERFNLAYREDFYTDDSSEDELAGYVYGGTNESNDSDDADYCQPLDPTHSPDDDDEFIHTLDADECKNKDIDVVVATGLEFNDENHNN